MLSTKTLIVASTALIAVAAAYKVEEPVARGESLDYAYEEGDGGSGEARGLGAYKSDDYEAFSAIVDMLLFDEDVDPEYADEGAR